MNLKPNLYDTLTPVQRVIATIEAEARNDAAEVDRLVTSCPKKTYTMNDNAYTDKLNHLMIMGLAIECDIRGQTIGFWIAMDRDRDDCAQRFLQNIADIQAAWGQTLNDLGIDPGTMAKAGPPRHGAIELLSDLLPEPDMKNVQIFGQEMRGFIEK
jgi:hypothetical protein